MKKISMIPVLKKYSSEDWQKILFDINLHFIEKAFMFHFWQFFICHDFRPIDQSLFIGMTNQMDVFFIE